MRAKVEVVRRWGLVALSAAVVAACGESGLTGVADTGGSPDLDVSSALSSSPSGAGSLVERTISGISPTDFATAGVGTASGDFETITVTIPSGATVEEVHLYWARRSDVDPATLGDQIEVKNGSTNTVTADVTSGPLAIDNEDPITYRADITSLGVVGSGTSSFDVKDATGTGLGASVLVFYSSGSAASVLRLFDGVDFLWEGEDTEALMTATPVTFSFPSMSVDRQAELTLFIGDIEPADATDRPNSLKITVGTDEMVFGSAADESPVFTGFDGPEWDNFTKTLTIPAGVDEVTVEPISGPDDSNPNNSASLVWATAGLSIEPPPSGGEGCTPGYWRQSHHFDEWVGYAPGDWLDEDKTPPGPFQVPSSLDLRRPERGDADDITLEEAIQLRGGGVNALIRHAVAALLNASNPDVSYDLTVQQVKDKFDTAVDGGDVGGTKDEFEGFNEQGCPLN